MAVRGQSGCMRARSGHGVAENRGRIAAVHSHPMGNKLSELGSSSRRIGASLLPRQLDAGMNAFVTARIRAVAQTVGAPHDESSNCVPNVLILFTLEPQQVIDEAIKHDSRALGFHYAEQEKKLATITRPIQGWYVTSTRNFWGTEMVDDPEPLGIADGEIATPKGANLYSIDLETPLDLEQSSLESNMMKQFEAH